MNLPAVQAALGELFTARYFAQHSVGAEPRTWYPCSQVLNYTQYASTVLPILDGASPHVSVLLKHCQSFPSSVISKSSFTLATWTRAYPP